MVHTQIESVYAKRERKEFVLKEMEIKSREEKMVRWLNIRSIGFENAPPMVVILHKKNY